MLQVVWVTIFLSFLHPVFESRADWNFLASSICSNSSCYSRFSDRERIETFLVMRDYFQHRELLPVFGSGADWNNACRPALLRLLTLLPVFGSGADWNMCFESHDDAETWLLPVFGSGADWNDCYKRTLKDTEGYSLFSDRERIETSENCLNAMPLFYYSLFSDRERIETCFALCQAELFWYYSLFSDRERIETGSLRQSQRCLLDYSRFSDRERIETWIAIRSPGILPPLLPVFGSGADWNKKLSFLKEK